jgi:hypothetical protein
MQTELIYRAVVDLPNVESFLKVRARAMNCCRFFQLLFLIDSQPVFVGIPDQSDGTPFTCVAQSFV